MRVAVVYYGGDFREAYYRLQKGGEETYHAEKYSVNAIARLTELADEVTHVCCNSPTFYDEFLQPGLRAIGAGVDPYAAPQTIIEIIADLNPTHLVICFPAEKLFKWAAKRRIRTIGVMADSFCASRLRDRVYHFWLGRTLNHPSIEWVANHGINACRSLEKIGVNPDKLVPWDWQHSISPTAFSVKSLSKSSSWKLFYAGSVSEAKGVGEILHAIAELKRRHRSVQVQIAGRGAVDQFRALAQQLQISENVEFLGLIPNTQVVHSMRQSDAVLVPSHHEYGEGLPCTIYEALCSRTPLVISDHPMFLGNLQHDVSAMIFPAQDAIALADQIEQLLSNPERYERLSGMALRTWEKIQIPVKWEDLLRRWLMDTLSDRNWLFEHRLTSEPSLTPLVTVAQ